MGKFDVKWTSGQGHMPKGTTYQQLVSVFGEPNKHVTENFKTDAEWVGTLDDDVFTIYNYKTGHSYLGDKGKDAKDITDWHIGGCVESIAEKVIEYFERTVKK